LLVKNKVSTPRAARPFMAALGRMSVVAQKSER
jgi:hypothetical protein